MPSLHEEAPPLPPPPQAPVSEEAEPARTASFASAPSQPASSLVRRALQPECSVDFPQITEICERLEIQPGEIRTTVAVLAKALRDRRQPLQVKLKALTIAHEMLYNQQVVEVFAEAEGLREALEALRQVRGNELGAAMDENVRMLATEIVGRCFEGKSSSNGWSSFAKAMSSDLDKARRAASKNFQHFSKKAEKHMQKAESVFERGATMLMQEAENMLSGPSSSNPKPALRGPEKQPALTTEDEQLQWALAQSLKEANRQKPGGYSEASNLQPPSAEDLSPEVLQADSRATAVEEALGAQLAAEDADAQATAQLSVKLEDAMNKAQHLATLLSKAEHELTGLKQHREMLEEKVLCAASQESHLQQLRKRLLELEAQAASISTAGAAPTDELQAAQGKMPAEIPRALEQEEHSIAATAVAANPQNEELSTSTTAVESNPQNEEHSIAATAVAANPQNEPSTSTTAVESNPQNEEPSTSTTAVESNPQNEENSIAATAVAANPQNEEPSTSTTAVESNPQNEVMDQGCLSRSDDAEAQARASSRSPEATSRECEESTCREKELFSADVGAEGQSTLADGLLQDHELQVSPKEVPSGSHEPAEAENAESEEMKQTGAAEVPCDLLAKPDTADETSVAQLTIPAAADTAGMPAPEATDAIDAHAGGVGEQLGTSAADAPGS